MIKVNKYCTDIMKKYFNKELMMNKYKDEEFRKLYYMLDLG